MKVLDKKGLLSGRYTVLDYGCGIGDDVYTLSKRGVDIIGYDPHFYPDIEKRTSDIVNLGFVLNVIESVQERMSVLVDAFSLSSKLLVVSCRIEDTNSSKFEKYGDGVITKRHTFQKYFNNDELRLFLETTLQKRALKVGNGIFFIHK